MMPPAEGRGAAGAAGPAAPPDVGACVAAVAAAAGGAPGSEGGVRAVVEAVGALARERRIEEVAPTLVADAIEAAGAAPPPQLALAVGALARAVILGATDRVVSKCLEGENAKAAAKLANGALAALEGLAGRLSGDADTAAGVILPVLEDMSRLAVTLAGEIRTRADSGEQSKKVCQFLLQRTRKLLAAAPAVASTDACAREIQAMVAAVKLAVTTAANGMQGIERNLGQVLAQAVGAAGARVWHAAASAGDSMGRAGVVALAAVEEAYSLDASHLEAVVAAVPAACAGLAAVWDGRVGEPFASVLALPRISGAVLRLATALSLAVEAGPGTPAARAWDMLQQWLAGAAADPHPAYSAVASRVYGLLLPSSTPSFAGAHLRAVMARLRASSPAWAAWAMAVPAGGQCAAAGRLEARAAASTLARMLVAAGAERSMAVVGEFVQPLAEAVAPASDACACMAAALLVEEAYAVKVPVVQDIGPLISHAVADARMAAAGDLDAEIRCSARLMALTAVLESGALGGEESATIAKQILSRSVAGADKENCPPAASPGASSGDELSLLRHALPRGAMSSLLRIAAVAAPALTPTAALEVVEALASDVNKSGAPIESIVEAAGAAAQAAAGGGGPAAQRAPRALEAVWKAALLPSSEHDHWAAAEGAAYAYQEFAYVHDFAAAAWRAHSRARAH